MKQKLFTLLTLLLVGISSAWADDYTETYTNPTGSNPAAGSAGMGAFTTIGNLTGDVSFGNSSLQIGTSSGSGTFTISSTDGSYITSITFTETGDSYVANTFTSDDCNVSGPTSKVWTFTPKTSTKTSVSFSLSAPSGKKTRLAPIVVNLTSDNEYLSMPFSVSSGTVSCTKSNASSDLTITTTGSASSNKLSLANTKTLTISSAGHNIKAVHFTYASHADVTLAASTGTYDSNGWSAGDDTQTVTFTSSASNVIVGMSVELAEISTAPSISADNVNIAASATGGNITYTINNPVVGGAVTAAKQGEADWLLTVGSGDSPIAFTTSTNTGIERSATVRLTYTYNTSETVTKDVTITQAAPTYTITYNPGSNGTGSIADGEKSYGVDFTLSSNTFTRDGYTQTGWATTDGGAQAYALGGSYTTDADITLYPVWRKTNTYNATFSYDSENPASAPAGWTFSNAGTYGASDATVAYEGSFGATFPGTGDCANENYVAFAKNASVYAKYDLGSVKTVAAVTGTFYVGSSSARTFTITYLGDDESVKHTITVNHPSGSNWGVDNVNEVATVSNVRYIKINGMASNYSWIVMSAFSVSTLYDEYVSVSTNASRNYGTMVTPAGKKLDFKAVEDDVKAYISPGLNAGKTAISIQKVSIVPAETPIIIKTTTQGATVNVPVTTEDADDVASINKLVAGDGTTNATPGEYTYFYIASDQFHQATGGTLTSGKAYLKLETATLGHELTFGFDESENSDVTGISEVKTMRNAENGDFFNLNGQRVNASHKGIVIVNGKKFLNK